LKDDSEKNLFVELAEHRALLEATADGYWVVDIEGKLIAVNHAYCKMSGYSEAELLEMQISDIENIESPEQTQGRIEKVLHKGSDSFTTIHRRKDGTLMDVDVTVTYIDVDGGKFVALLRDITEENSLFRTLKQQQETLKQAQQLASIGSWNYNQRDATLTWSDELYRLLGWEPQEVDATFDLFMQHVHPEDRKRVQKVYEASLANKTSYQIIHRIFTKKGELRHVEALCDHVVDNAGNVVDSIGTVHDITENKEHEIQIKRLAYYDALTNLPNRSLLDDRLLTSINHANRSKSSIAVCLVDLDGFKEVNDQFGHSAGDSVLIDAAERMCHSVREDDTVARLGGDEFVLILTNLAKGEDCAVTLYRMLNLLAEPYMYDGNRISSVSASIGVSIYPDDRVEADTLLRHADMAMYKAKNSGKNRFSFFDVVSDQKIKANHRTITKLKNALIAGEFCFYYQPKADAATGSVVELEALARWNHPMLGILSPAEFLPLIENDETLCSLFDTWVVTTALRQLDQWQKEDFSVKICINISPRQFKSNNFIAWLKDVVTASGISMELLSYLEFEILETAAVESHVRSNEIIRECKEMGITFALDDFGTGYSSLMHLRDLNVDTIKIDQMFVKSMLENSSSMVIVQAIVALANAFDIKVTAEGAETIEHVVALLEMGCDDIQGYAIARPMPPESVKSFVQQYKTDPKWQMASQLLPSKADFELLLAASNLRYWADRVVESLTKEQLDVEPITLDVTQCRFGKWLESTKNRRYENAASFQKILAEHQALHELVTQTAERLKSEARTINPDETQQIRSAVHQLLDLLALLRHEMEKIKQENNLINKILHKRSHHGK